MTAHGRRTLERSLGGMTSLTQWPVFASHGQASVSELPRSLLALWSPRVPELGLTLFETDDATSVEVFWALNGEATDPLHTVASFDVDDVEGLIACVQQELLRSIRVSAFESRPNKWLLAWSVELDTSSGGRTGNRWLAVARRRTWAGGVASPFTDPFSDEVRTTWTSDLATGFSLPDSLAP